MNQVGPLVAQEELSADGAIHRGDQGMPLGVTTRKHYLRARSDAGYLTSE